MRICTSVGITWMPGDYSDDVESIEAECSRCGNVTTSFGTGEASERRCLVMLRESCPQGENNYYVTC